VIDTPSGVDDLADARRVFERMKLGRYPEPSGDEFDLFYKIAAEVQWPKVWLGGELDLKTRSLCTVAALMAVGESKQIQDHIRGAMLNGATRQEIADVITHTAFYTGFPTSGKAVRAARSVFAEFDGAGSEQ
jgi:alkylhydroperoxidase/carboxymuconolactone decarboxylase family protein YurZ